MTVLIAGGGIAGLSLALTCQQIGVPFKVFEQVQSLRPLGVGINLQPNAVRELFDLGLEELLPTIGVQTREYGMFSKHGLEIWNEPRGKWAGYTWPQYSVHRGQLQIALADVLTERAGPDCLELGWQATGYSNRADGVILHLKNREGNQRDVAGSFVFGADGIHSSIRAQMNPDEGPPIWGGAVLWRSTTTAKPFRTGASMAMIGHDTQRVVAYPISPIDPDTGTVVMNWIAELSYDPSAGWNKEDWNRKVGKEEFLPQFENWVFDWLDFPSWVDQSDTIYEYPMVDRDPLSSWTDGRATLIGDAAHATYPVGSNGASQAIIDTRKMGRAFVDHGFTTTALNTYEDEMRPASTRIIEANRGGGGPDAVLQMIEDRCQGQFDSIDDVASHDELAAHAAAYKSVSGFSIDALNAALPIIPQGAKVS